MAEIGAVAQELGLLDSEVAFVAEYLTDLNATRAYKAVHTECTDAAARVSAHRTLTRANVQEAIRRVRAGWLEKLDASGADVIRQLYAVAMADPRELVQVKRGACRHCHGEGHLYQFTDGEFEAEQIKAERTGEVFDEKGGAGYSVAREPHPDCPMCAGDGEPRIVLADTEKLSPMAQALYAGAKMGKTGLEVQMHDKMVAIEKLAKHLGLYAADNKQKTATMSEWLTAMGVGAARSALPVVQDEGGEA